MMFRLLAMDVDGTLTDGSVFIDAAGNEFKRFDIQDGMGMVLFRKAGGKVAWISGRFSAGLSVEFLYFPHTPHQFSGRSALPDVPEKGSSPESVLL